MVCQTNHYRENADTVNLDIRMNGLFPRSPSFLIQVKYFVLSKNHMVF